MPARVLLTTLLILATVACQDGDITAQRSEQRLVVFAAASLRGAFTAIEREFEGDHPEADVLLNFAGTQELRTQLEHGAAVDVFASADRLHMDALVATGLVLDPVVFAHNEPVVVVAREAATTIRSLADLAVAQRLVLGADEVPIGRYAKEILDRAARRFGPQYRSSVETRVVSRELNVRQVLAKVSLGEADAGIVYRSDTLGATEVTVVDIPADLNVIADYPIAIHRGAAQPELARTWIARVCSSNGQRVLRDSGFTAPAPGC